MQPAANVYPIQGAHPPPRPSFDHLIIKRETNCHSTHHIYTASRQPKPQLKILGMCNHDSDENTRVKVGKCNKD